MMYLVIALIILVAAIVYGGYDPAGARKLSDDGTIETYYMMAFGVSIAWPLAILFLIMAGIGLGLYYLGKSLRKK